MVWIVRPAQRDDMGVSLEVGLSLEVWGHGIERGHTKVEGNKRVVGHERDMDGWWFQSNMEEGGKRKVP